MIRSLTASHVGSSIRGRSLAWQFRTANGPSGLNRPSYAEKCLSYRRSNDRPEQHAFYTAHGLTYVAATRLLNLNAFVRILNVSFEAENAAT